MFGPLITITPISYLSGYYAEKEINVDGDEEANLNIANKFFFVHYLIWSFWLIIFVISMLYYWYILFDLLNHHMKGLKEKSNHHTNRWKLETLEVASTNLSSVSLLLAFLYTFFTVIFIIFGLTYKSTTARDNYQIGLFYFAVWNFLIPVCLQVVQFVIIYNAVRPSQSIPLFDEILNVSLKKPRFSISLNNEFSTNKRKSDEFNKNFNFNINLNNNINNNLEEDDENNNLFSQIESSKSDNNNDNKFTKKSLKTITNSFLNLSSPSTSTSSSPSYNKKHRHNLEWDEIITINDGNDDYDTEEIFRYNSNNNNDKNKNNNHDQLSPSSNDNNDKSNNKSNNSIKSNISN
ncbi:4286_t:CDS:2 [Entrophospora sp. SA101]|nr:4286_t:CDS:2 [Entrophospora sp. SA101]CAJ0843456.1 18619_t:CDS:2 [Entrophospora sp. SA101]